MPVSARHAITPARITEGSAPVSTTKRTTTPNPSAKRPTGPIFSTPANARMGASTIATFSPETTNRCPRPVAWKSRVGDGVELRGVAQDEPEEQPRLARREEPFDRAPTNARNTWVIRTKGDEAPPIRWTSIARTLDGEPAVRERGREAGIVGTCRCPGPRAGRRGRPRASRRSPLTHTVSRTAAAPPGHEARVTSTSACQPYALGSGSSRSVARSVTVLGARRAAASALRGPPPGLPSRRHRAAPRRPTSAMAGPGPRRRSVARGVIAATAGQDRRRRVPTCGADRRRVAREPAAVAPARATHPSRSHAHHGQVDAGAGRSSHRSTPAQNADARGAPQPARGHTVTWERRSSRVAGPIPDTSSS